MRAIRSLLHPQDLSRLVEREYEVDAPITVRLLRPGFNDTYVVTDAGGGRRVLRVYNRGKYWITSESDLRYELEMLDELATQGRAVAGPYRRAAGDLLGRLEAPEGVRYFALFTHADGVPITELDPDPARMQTLGAEIARVHDAMAGFRSDHQRYHLDVDLLIGMPLTAIQELIGSQDGAGFDELQTVGQQLGRHITALDLPTQGYGPIHADLSGNIHVDADGRFTFFDFDHCGIGWRAYDLVSFYPEQNASAREHEGWSALLAGYDSVRKLSNDERDTFPTFAACRALWDVGDWLRAAEWAGERWSPTSVCTKTLNRIRRAMGNTMEQKA